MMPENNERTIGKSPTLGMPYTPSPGTPADDPYAAFTLAPAIADMHDVRLFDCPDCQQFGTICRPCRAARYEARRVAERRVVVRRRLRVVYWVFGIAALLVLAQCHMDRSCAPGRWDAEALACAPR